MKSKVKPGINDLQTMHPHTAAQWHTYKNGRLTPKEVFAYSGKKVWWQTAALWHKGRNGDTETLDGMELDLYLPEENIAFEYNGLWAHSFRERKLCDARKLSLCREKNILLIRICETRTVNRHVQGEHLIECVADGTWEYLTAGSSQRVHWKHTAVFQGREFLHAWKATVKSRMQGNGCPYCGNKKVLKGYNDLESCYPEIAEKWDRIRNAPALPDGFTSASARRVYWTDRVKPVKISDRTK